MAVVEDGMNALRSAVSYNLGEDRSGGPTSAGYNVTAG